MTIYNYATDDSGQRFQCTNLEKPIQIVEHEIGHILGLCDEPASATSAQCKTDIMAPTNGLDHSISNEDCQDAGQNYTPPNPPPGPIGECTLARVRSFDLEPEANTCGDSPIILNLSNGPYELTGLDDPVMFDIEASGRPVQIGWTATGRHLGFLCLDRNGNGRIDDGSELFGNFTALPDGSVASNGFEALKGFDSNGDGVIDPNDTIWPDLLLWFDLNHDGVSEPWELKSLDDVGVQSLSLRYRWTGRVDEYGNAFRYGALVARVGPGGEPILRPFFDIYFVRGD